MRRLRACAVAALWLVGSGRTPSVRADEGQATQCKDEDLAGIRGELERLRRETRDLRTALAGGSGGGADEQTAEARMQALAARIVRLEADLRRVSTELQRASNAVDTLSQVEERKISLAVYGNLAASAYRGEHSLLDGELFELVLSGRPHKRLAFIAQVEFERAAGVGGERGGEVVVEQAYANFNVWSALNLRAGVLLVPFGNVNVDHFPSKREVVTRPLVSQVVVPGDWTDNGVGLYGRKLLGKSWLVSYEAYVLAGLGSGVTGLGLHDARQAYGADNNGNKALLGHLTVSSASRLEVGLSAYTGKYDDAGRRDLGGWSVTGAATLGPVRVTGEYDSFIADRAPEPDARLRGFYARVAYDFAPSFLARTSLGKDFEAPRLTLVFQYDRASVDGPLDGEFVSNRERRLTGCVLYRPSTQWVLKLAYESNATRNRPLALGDRDGWLGSIAFVF